MASVETPIGRLEWHDPVLTESTIVTIIKDVNGSPFTRDQPLSTIIAMTNGGIIEYLPEHPEVVPLP